MAEEAGASKKPKKYTGILLHPTSLPGPYGIGELGASAYRFVDFLERSGLNTWQVLLRICGTAAYHQSGSSEGVTSSLRRRLPGYAGMERRADQLW